MTMKDAAPEICTHSSSPPMSTRWWLFLIFLWTFALVGAAPLLLLPAVEIPTRIAENFPIPDVTSVSVIKKKPLLDWMDRHGRYSLEVVRGETVTRYGSPRSPYSVEIGLTGVELKSSEGTIYVPLAPTAK